MLITEGFFAHFVNMKTESVIRKVNIQQLMHSILNGIIAVSSYFDNEEINKYSDLIIKRVNWRHFFHKKRQTNTLYGIQ